MWPFKSTKTIQESGLFNNFTDWHSHILPGVDDGMKTMEESLDALSELEQLGVRKVWLTPHIMEDYPNETSALRARFEELREVWNGNIELRLAAENMLDNLFESRLETNDFLPIGDEGNHLLVETSYYTPPMGMDDILERTRAKGYFIILAHPERYRYMDEKDYVKLKDMGIAFQMNFMSLAGGYGETARKKAIWLLQKGMIDYTGSDVHRMSMLRNAIYRGVNKDSVNRLLEVVNS